MTDIGTDVPESSVESLDIGLSVMSLVTPMPIDLEPGISDRNMEHSGSLLLFVWGLEYLWVILTV